MSVSANDEKFIKYRNSVLCRNHLDRLSMVPAINEIDQEPPYGELIFYRVHGISEFWKNDSNISFDSIFGDLLNGIAIENQSILTYVLIGIENEIRLYLGTSMTHGDWLESILKGSFPQITLKKTESSYIKNQLKQVGNVGGIVTGYPVNKRKNGSDSIQIERLCKGMYGSEWAYIVIAKSIEPYRVQKGEEKLLNELSEISGLIKQSYNQSGSFGHSNVEYTSYLLQRFFENIKALEEKVFIGKSRSMWRVCSYYATPTEQEADRLRNMVKSVFSGEESKPEPIRTIPVENIGSLLQNFNMISELSDEMRHHPAGEWQDENGLQRFLIFKYQTVMNSDDLSTFMQLSRKEFPGYFINQFVDFESAERREKGNFPIGKILYGNEEIDTEYKMELSDLNRHGLIIGMTGGGKTNTSKGLLKKIWRDYQIPFMVIESAKKEYWELFNESGMEELSVFTLGTEKEIPFRMNPFEKMKHTQLQTHIDYLMSTFKASFELYPPMPYILETSLYSIYEDRGWDVLENRNIYGREDDFPTLDDLYYKIDIVVENLGYDDRLKFDITAALKARINSLKVGGKGAIINTAKSIPISELLTKPVVIELDDIGDDDVKAFIIGILLVQLYEYRGQPENNHSDFSHLILIEEAHRLLANVGAGGEGGNSRAKAVEFFTNLLAEIRSYGQGFLIADQVPTKLAPDTLKNTNLKIVHRIVTKDDRDLIGKAMNMTEGQIDYLSTLKRGEAAVYAEGDQRPKLVKFSPPEAPARDWERKRVIAHLQKKSQNRFNDYHVKYTEGPACSFCLQQCEHRELMKEFEEKMATDERLKDVGEVLSNDLSYDMLTNLFDYLKQLGFYNEPLTFHQKLCLLNPLLEAAPLSDGKKRELIITFLRHSYKSEVSK